MALEKKRKKALFPSFFFLPHYRIAFASSFFLSHMTKNNMLLIVMRIFARSFVKDLSATMPEMISLRIQTPPQ